MSDLRESGEIEQDADIVAFLYRDEYYNKSDEVTPVELIVAKNRDGEIGTVHLSYIGEITRFFNCDSRRRKY
jgi:replicative DNA helicase